MAVDNSLRIAEIREILRSGVSTATTDGTTTTLDLDSLRRELRDLIAEDSLLQKRKPRVSSFNLGNA